MNSESKKLVLTGYATVRKFGGYAIPVPIQNRLLRDYCKEQKYIYKLPLVETCLTNNFMHLHQTLDACTKLTNIGMCSIYMFPHETKKFNSLRSKIEEKELRFHFLFENIVVESSEIEEAYFDSRLRYLEL